VDQKKQHFVFGSTWHHLVVTKLHPYLGNRRIKFKIFYFS